MWRTESGDRILCGAEWDVFREGLSGLWDVIDEAHEADDTHALGIQLFDELQYNQKLAMLVFVGEALSHADIKSPELTAVGESTIAAVFAWIMQEVAMEIDLDGEPKQSDDDDPADWTIIRKLIVAAYHQFQAEIDDDEFEGDREDDVIDAGCTDLDTWHSAIEVLQDRILWADGDFEMGPEFLDLGPVARKRLLKRLNIAEGYFLGIAPDPTDREMAAILSRLANLTGRVLRE